MPKNIVNCQFGQLFDFVAKTLYELSGKISISVMIEVRVAQLYAKLKSQKVI